MDEQESLKKKLDLLKDEHRELDTMIDDLLRETVVNQLAVQRLKKKKLLVRDHIARINAQLLPDIIA
ncbi:MAG: DUF465 domain-containing protein [Alphaproteobacteria bacterium]|nr:DUF465 domain-containing protein [Alphaproteobacteria bacterium]NCQ67602.1 DUF465 domain-containing protein [Alphaproteobacteria bacterium]NCT08374.1 DUF465 domain-containing protein [Alphaproteobacteria bacterium]